MKNIIAIAVLAVMVDAGYWGHFGSSGVSYYGENSGQGYGHGNSHGHGHGHGHGPGYVPEHNPFPYPSWNHPHHRQEENVFPEPSQNNADWICRNQKTGATISVTTQAISGEDSHHHPYYPHGNTEGQQPGHSTLALDNTPPPAQTQRPIAPETKSPETVYPPSTQKPSTTAPEVQTERYHGGEGKIDFRSFGPEN